MHTKKLMMKNRTHMLQLYWYILHFQTTKSIFCLGIAAYLYNCRCGFYFHLYLFKLDVRLPTFGASKSQD